MGWGTAKTNLRELFGTGSNCSLSPANDTGSAGERVGAGGGFMASVVIVVIVVTSCLF